jgi:integrase
MAKNGSRSGLDEGRIRIGEYVTMYLRGRIWYAQYMVDRQQQRASLKTRNKKEARRRAIQIDARLIAGTCAARLKAQLVNDAADAYLAYLKTEGRSEGTLARYTPELTRFATFAAEHGVTRLSAVSIRLMDSYRAWRTDAGAEPATIYHESIVIKQLFNFALARDMIANNPLDKFRPKKPKTKDPKAFILSDVEAILRHAHDRYAPIFELLAFTGIRIGELSWLTWDDIDFERGFIEVRAKDNWKPKDGDDRSIPMHGRIRRLLNSLPHEGRWVFVGPQCPKYPDGGQRVSERRALRALKRAAKAAAIPEDIRKLHTFRHFFASYCANNGVEMAKLMKWLGHSSVEMVMKYYTLEAEESRQAMLSVPFDGIAKKSAS